MIRDEIKTELFRQQDTGYRSFQGSLIPAVAEERIIGVRTPVLRRLAKQLGKREDIGDFLEELPHEYFDENQLHAFLISEIRDFGDCMEQVHRFLPYVDNWATCDQMSPKVFKKQKKELLCQVREWIASEETYTIRFGIRMLMDHFLEEEFELCFPEVVSRICSEEYYVRMMVAWYFATALAKQYEAVLPWMEEQRLDPWTHNKTIQKSTESRRIPEQHKEYLRSLRV